MSGDITLPAEPPYVVVIFRSLRTDATEGYAEAAERMAALVSEQAGYLSHWSTRDAQGRGVTLSYWTDESAARAWKDVAEHLVVQARGAREWYEVYSTEVAVVQRSYLHQRPPGTQAELALPIRTERLVLRELVPGDLDNHLRLVGDERVVRYLYEEVMDREAAREHLARRMPARLPEEDAWLNLAVEFEGRYVGEAGVCLRSRQHRQAEIGYGFVPEATGQGLATEAARAMVDFAFARLDAHRVIGRLDARNERSARLLERLGMRLEGRIRENEYVKGEWTDELLYAITAPEWAASRGESRG